MQHQLLWSISPWDFLFSNVLCVKDRILMCLFSSCACISPFLHVEHLTECAVIAAERMRGLERVAKSVGLIRWQWHVKSFYFTIKLDLLARLTAPCPHFFLRTSCQRIPPPHPTHPHTHTFRKIFLSTRGIHSPNPELLQSSFKSLDPDFSTDVQMCWRQRGLNMLICYFCIKDF